MKKLLCFIISFVVLASQVSALEVFSGDVSAKSAVLYDPLTERIIWSKNPDERMAMASTTKIMTALLSLELYDLDTQVEILPSWTGAEGSSMYLKPGEKMTIEELVYGLMLMSGNDAAVALSNILTSNQQDFIELMNLKATELGLENTSFENPNGLDGQNHYSTATDMAKLASEAMKNSVFCEIVSSKNAQMAGRYMKNHNKLLTMYPSSCGVKTGYTKKAGRCLVSAAEENGRQLIAVTLSAPDDWNDHIKLYNAAFDSMKIECILNSGQVGEIPVVSGVSDKCSLYVVDEFSYPMLPEDGEQVYFVLNGPRMVYAPVASGDKYGSISVVINGMEVYESDVYYKTDIDKKAVKEKSFFQKIIDKIFRM